MSRNNFTTADEIFVGRVAFGPAGDHRGVPFIPLTGVDLGSPEQADADGVCETQSLNAGIDADLDGALVSDGVAVFDVPRNVVAAWTGTAVLTVTGEDQYGQALVESS